jgi:hypothetical protein
MSNNPYDRGYGYANPNHMRPAGQQNSAVVSQPSIGQMGGRNPNQPSWFRFPFFPTAPFYSTNPNVSTQVRYYSTGITSADADVTLGQETIRTTTFDIPARVIAINAAFAYTAVPAAANNPFARGITNPLDLFLFRMEYTTGDRLHINSRLASTVCGSAENPSEIGGVGYTVDQGASLITGITPLATINDGVPTAWRIDVTFHCLEMRGSANFVGGR